MQIGPLRQRVTIQDFTVAQNAYGEPVETWANVTTVWAEVLPARGQERFVAAGDQQLATLTHVVRMRYYDGLSPVDHRLVWGSITLDVESVQDPDGRRREMRVLCREVLN